jgi:hypothetical protein
MKGARKFTREATCLCRTFHMESQIEGLLVWLMYMLIYMYITQCKGYWVNEKSEKFLMVSGINLQ